MVTTKPDLTRVWANGAPPANVVDPDTTTPGKVLAGWQAEVPPFEHFNFLQKWFTQGLAHFNEQGIGVWDTDTTYPVNGLAKGSDGKIYIALVEQNGNDPISDDGVNWRILISDNNTVKVSELTSTRDVSAVRLAIDFAVANGYGVVDLGSYEYDFTSGGTVNISNVTDLKIRGSGAVITAPTTGAVENIFFGGACDNVTIDGVIIKGGTNHCISLNNPSNFRVINCQFFGQVGFAVIMFTPDRGASGVAKNNHIINCFNDGQGAANGGFGMESMVDSTIVNPVVTGVTVATPGYAVNLKNACKNTHVYNHLVYGNANGMVYSDDGGGSGVGSGCRNCTSTGSAYNHDQAGVSMHRTNQCRVSAYIDQQDNNNGTDPNNHAGLAVQGFCTNDSIEVDLYNINSAQKAINVRSEKETIFIRSYDLSSPNMLSLDSTAEQNRVTLLNYDTASNLFNPSSYIDDQGSSNEFTNMRRLRNNIYVFDVDGENLTDYQLGALLNQITTRVAGTNCFVVDTNLNVIGPATGQDNVFSAGRVDKRYTEVFAANGTINTSDERQKTELLEISAAEKECALEIKASIRKYQMLDAIEKKGADGARVHFGVGAQTIKAIFEKHGLDAARYSLFCYDEWDGTEEIKDKEGNILQEATEAGNAYGVRYDQLAMFILGGI